MGEKITYYDITMENLGVFLTIKPTVHIQYYFVRYTDSNIFQNVFKYIDAMTIYFSLFHLLNTVLDTLNIHINMVNILRKSHIIINNIERVQRAYRTEIPRYLKIKPNSIIGSVIRNTKYTVLIFWHELTNDLPT